MVPHGIHTNYYLVSFFYLLVIVGFLSAILSFLAVRRLRIELPSSNNANQRKSRSVILGTDLGRKELDPSLIRLWMAPYVEAGILYFLWTLHNLLSPWWIKIQPARNLTLQKHENSHSSNVTVAGFFFFYHIIFLRMYTKRGLVKIQ